MKLRFVRVALLSISVLITSVAHAGPYSNLYIFGDSLSDTGNLAHASGGALPPLPAGSGFNGPYYGNAQLSNGPVWTEHLAAGLGLSPMVAAPSLMGGNNYAFAGALTDTSSTPPGVLAQIGGPKAVGLFGANPFDMTVADPSALYVVIAGGNDMRAARSLFKGNTATDIDGRQAAAVAAMTNLTTSIAVLASLGAKHFLVSTVPNLGYTPEAALLDLVDASTDATTRLNSMLPSLTLFGQSLGLDMYMLDMAKLTDDIVTDAVFRASVGITNFDTPCAGFEYSAGASCDQSLFADVLHPSGYAHTLIAKAALEALGIPEPSSLPLVLLALMSFALITRRNAIRQKGE